MADASFHPKHALHFDLARGSLVARGAEAERLVLVPARVMVEVVGHGGAAAGAAVGRLIGEQCGRRIERRFGGPNGVRARSIDEMSFELSGELSMMGIGNVVLERWGR